MSDFCWAQINACWEIYMGVMVLLCWWHVLHAWQQHLRIKDHPEVWTTLKGFVRITDKEKFDSTWLKIKQTAPAGFVEYLETYWMTERVVRMWSAVFRKDRSLLEQCDTNMLVEACHHVLKGKFFRNRRNRRLDHLISTLVTEVVPYYRFKQRRQDIGFEGPDVEVKKRRDIVQRSQQYTEDDFEQVDDARYVVCSKSDPTVSYDIDIDAYSCSCPDFPLILFCKHLCALQNFVNPDRLPAPKATVPGDTPAAEPALPLPEFSPPESDLSPVVAEQSVPKARRFADLLEKLQRMTARLRRPSRKLTDATVDKLTAAVDAVLLETEDHSVIPTSSYIPPNNKSDWQQTKGSMVPGLKRHKKPTNDDPYSAGVASGQKAAKKPRKRSVFSCRDREQLMYFAQRDNRDRATAATPAPHATRSERAVVNAPVHVPRTRRAARRRLSSLPNGCLSPTPYPSPLISPLLLLCTSSRCIP
ncbi:hypothetical protein FB45DRAFT_838498 [Roridomyces roridus]|uniref:SWIM-type domain-containing protein n=1 Tax=Roridomyces roridus TaxID=1738132 RepID=A0AAD7BJ56_9AGAR|nr:hypothetical protein FB45DRAFT_838498 [Roridomyces roridus]